jgi:hypothetical protein
MMVPTSESLVSESESSEPDDRIIRRRAWVSGSWKLRVDHFMIRDESLPHWHARGRAGQSVTRSWSVVTVTRPNLIISSLRPGARPLIPYSSTPARARHPYRFGPLAGSTERARVRELAGRSSESSSGRLRVGQAPRPRRLEPERAGPARNRPGRAWQSRSVNLDSEPGLSHGTLQGTSRRRCVVTVRVVVCVSCGSSLSLFKGRVGAAQAVDPAPSPGLQEGSP